MNQCTSNLALTCCQVFHSNLRDCLLIIYAPLSDEVAKVINYEERPPLNNLLCMDISPIKLLIKIELNY